MRGIFFLADSFNRRFIDFYNESGMHLPNLSRLASHSVIFDNHFTGSAPCMPARRDLLTGRLNFLERGWGPVEAFDCTLPQLLRQGGVRSHITTDHYHYFEIGGDNYCQMFDTWDFHRGQEHDKCPGSLEKIRLPEHIGKYDSRYFQNRRKWTEEELYPSPMTVKAGCQWLEENHEQDNFLLWVETFDPHEPFDVPQKYLDRVKDDYHGKPFFWSPYCRVDEAGFSEEEILHLRRRYAALLLMTDEWLGRLLDVMDAHDMWKDTFFIFTTDHGYMLGEHGYLAKNYMPAYNEVFHIPLTVHVPGFGAGEHCGALTQNIDILPTVMELYGIPPEYAVNKLHGESLMSLLRQEKTKLRDAVLYGYFGKAVNVTDGTYTLFKKPCPGNRPLYVYTSMPVDINCYFDRKRITDYRLIEMGRYLQWTEYPVYRIPADAHKPIPKRSQQYLSLHPWDEEDYLFDLRDDYAQNRNLYSTEPYVADYMKRLLRTCLERYDAPAEQLERLELDTEGVQ